jgi:hypothetical protein
MLFMVKVRVNLSTLKRFGDALAKNRLDRSCMKSDTWCLRDDPAVGFSIWEAENRESFEKHFTAWREYYEHIEVLPVIPPMEAMKALIAGLK